MFEDVRHARTAQIQVTSHRKTWMRQRTDGGWLYDHYARSAPLDAEPVPSVTASP